MAIVVLPCLGIEAAGQIAHGFVYLRWKGQTHVKAWKKPTDPKSQWQARDRTYFSAAGHVCKFIYTWSQLAAELRGAAPGNMPWSSYFIGQMIGTGNVDIEESLTAWDTAANTVTWQSVAGSLRVRDQLHPRAEIDAITGGEIVFISARAVFRMGLAATTIDAQDMSAAQIVSYVDLFDCQYEEFVIPPPE